MHACRNPDEYLPEFFGRLFAPDDNIVVVRIDYSPNDASITNESLPRDAAVSRILDDVQHGVPNLFFRAAAHDGSRDYKQARYSSIRAFYIDVDYGHTGHKDDKPEFGTRGDAFSYLLTMPLRPSTLWHTGHGFQATFLLDKPYALGAGGHERYKDAGRRLTGYAKADSAFTVDHAYRVPLTVNDKRGKFPRALPVPGEVLVDQPGRLYAIEEIEAHLADYGVEDLMQADAEETVTDTPGVDCSYELLPRNLRDRIEKHYRERSDTLWGIVCTMVREGYSDGTIRDAIGHGSSFRTYGHKLERHIRRCLEKTRRTVYSTRKIPSIRVNNIPETVGIRECHPLPRELSGMLDRYAAVTGAEITDRLLMGLRFHEDRFTRERAGVIESACGSGKSTWALCHIAVNASPAARYFYVCETVERLYSAADDLDKLAGVAVGRVHGFNPAKCEELCGRRHTWRECRGRARGSKCNTCGARTDCRFYNRDSQKKCPILCMTHNGFIRLLEEDSGLLDGARIIIDENLTPFNGATLLCDDLWNLQAFAPNLLNIVGPLFPGSRLANWDELGKLRVPETAATFARLNFVFCNEDRSAALTGVYDALRRIRIDHRSPDDPFKPASEERAEETLVLLLNTFRPARRNDATYAFREFAGEDGLAYDVIRSRFSLHTARPYDRLWILNASAQLSPVKYPDDMPLYTCPDLPDVSHLLTIHTVRANPTKRKLDQAVDLSEVILQHNPDVKLHKRIMIATNKGETMRRTIESQMCQMRGEPEITWVTRGRIKGRNDAGDCTLVYLTGMPLFTTLPDLALRAALLVRRTYPEVPHILKPDGNPNWNAGMPAFPVLATLYGLTALDEAYQALWRCCIRNDKPAEAIIAVPSADWLVTLWKTVAPRFKMGQAVKVSGANAADDFEETTGMSLKAIESIAQPTEHIRGAKCSLEQWRGAKFIWEQDDRLAGLELISMPPGSRISKGDAARAFGYRGERAWDRHKAILEVWLGEFFDIGHLSLVRKP